MLKNYELLENGIIKQIKINKIKYDEDYVKKYDNYGENNLKISYLRLGNIIGSIGRIPNSILDVGCGNGSFLTACSSIINNCYGFDVVDYELLSPIKKCNNIFENEYDVVTFFDSLEHFDDIKIIKNIKCNFICVSVPWCHYFSDDWFKNWKHRRENEHIWHFNKNSLEIFFKECGYTIVSSSNIEDSIRKNLINEENILTCVFKKDSK
jgi:SAM-dependent methyltransferase